MKKLILLFFLCVFSSVVLGAKITDETLTIGNNAANDILIKHKDGGYLKKAGSQGDWLFSNDGVLEKKIGSGSGSGGDGGVNILSNNSFEDGLTDWSNTGGTFTQQTYTNSQESNTKYARFVATASGEYFESACTDKPDIITGGGMGDIRYLGGSGNFDLKIIDCTTSDVVISEATLADTLAWEKAPTQVFTMPAKFKLRVESTAAGTIDVDLPYAGSNKGFISSQAQAKSVEYTPVFTEFGTPSEVDFTYMHIGDKLHIQGRFRVGTLASSTEARVSLPPGFITKFADGFGKPVGYYFRHITNANNGGTVIAVNGRDYLAFSSSSIFSSTAVNPSFSVSSGQMLNNNEVVTLNVIVPVASSSPNTQEALVPEQAEFGYIGVFNAVGGATASSFTPVIDSSGLCELQNKKGSANITCHNGSTGTTNCDSFPSDEQFGIQIYLPVVGRYKVCATSSMDNGGANRYRINKYINETNTIEVAGDIEVRSPTDAGFSSLCQEFEIGSIGLHTFKVDVFALNTAYNFCNSKNSSMTVDLVGHNTSRPNIQNMVDSRGGKRKGVESCRILYTGTPTVDTASQMCGWVDSLTPITTGRYTLAIKAGTFSLPPVCVASPSSGGSKIGSVNNTTASSVEVLNYSDAGSLEAGTLNIRCEGLR